MADDRDETRQTGDETKAPHVNVADSSSTAAELFESGWTHYSKKEYYRAEEDFKKSLDIVPENGDVAYGLGMAVSASGRRDEAIQIFEKAIELLQQNKEEDWARVSMLTRLARGHINRIKTGDWHLEK